MSSVPLQLESFFVESLTYQATQDFDRTKPPVEAVTPAIEGPYVHKNDPRRFMLKLRVRVGRREATNARCEMDFSLVGFFVLAENLEAKLAGAMTTQNAPSILYGVARQVVAEMTSNGPWGKVFIPTVNFVEIAAAKARVAHAAKPRPDYPVVSDKPAAAKK